MRDHSGLDRLTEREQAVLALIAQGWSNATICERLWITKKTLETHTGSIFAKLGLLPTPRHNRRVLAALAYQRHVDVSAA